MLVQSGRVDDAGSWKAARITRAFEGRLNSVGLSSIEGFRVSGGTVGGLAAGALPAARSVRGPVPKFVWITVLAEKLSNGFNNAV